jgi:hypothetical protein
MSLDPTIVAARLQDINEGLVRQSGGLVETHFRKSKRLGAAARICSLIRGSDVVSEYEALLAACGELGIIADTVDLALSELQEVGYVTLHRAGGEIRKIEERIPLLGARYAAIGQRWLDSKPSEIEMAAVSVVDDLLLAPNRERTIVQKLGLDSKTFGIIRDVGDTGDFYKTYQSPVDGSTISYSPLYHDENPGKLIALMDAFPHEDVTEHLRRIRTYQGKPIDAVTDPVLVQAIRTGCIPTPTVNSTAGPKRFMFTPLQGVGKLEKCLLEKARAIVACVRYGEHFAGITRIFDPRMILSRLQSRKVIGPHSEIKDQYVLLQKLGVGRIARDPQHRNRYNFHLLDTDENLKALDLAIQYLTVQEVVKGNPKEADARQLLLPGIYGSPTKTRMELRQVQETKLSADSINKLNHLIIGGSSGIH